MTNLTGIPLFGCLLGECITVCTKEFAVKWGKVKAGHLTRQGSMVGNTWTSLEHLLSMQMLTVTSMMSHSVELEFPPSNAFY